MIVMLVGGLWHGANWTFVLWGGLHGLLLVINRLWRDYAGPFRLPGVVAGPIPLSALASPLGRGWRCRANLRKMR